MIFPDKHQHEICLPIWAKFLLIATFLEAPRLDNQRDAKTLLLDAQVILKTILLVTWLGFLLAPCDKLLMHEPMQMAKGLL